ncbi:TonB-dependent receptor [Chitinophaga pendula]|uniref:TonB-dependent receptor n=1 Tax=Chitinophaga TaxID=79328 RepID=UPI0018DFE210|nr:MULTISPECIES: TonB-dependent receptor [Chitinophaga]UCJ09572.1 TonB-dependent receptor [Chitinophaga pendula]
MKLSFFIVLLSCMQVWGNANGQRLITVNLNDVQLTKLLKEIEKQSDFRFVYRNDMIPTNRKVSLHATNASLDQVMAAVLSKTDLTYRLLSSNLVAIAPENANIAEITVKGKVTNELGQPLPGVSIRIVNINRGSSTDANGEYEIKAPSTAVLEFTHIGFIQQRVPVENRKVLNITLKDDAKGLSEVVVVAYNTQTKASFTGSASTLKPQAFDKAPRASFQEGLQGNIAGVQSVNGSGQPGSVPNIRIRGVGSITAGSTPLYVIDGVPVVSSSITDYNVNNLAGINGADIESVTVLKDASAASLYGSRAANGVILITTKKGKSGKTSFSISAQQGVNLLTIPKKDRPLNTSEMVELLREGFTNRYPGKVDSFNNVVLKNAGIDTTVNTDWIDALTRSGNFSQVNLSASGGNDKTRFYASGGIYNSKAALKGVGYNRATAKVNVTNTANDRLSFDLNLGLNYQKGNAVGDAGGFANPVRSLYRLQPWLRIYNPDGSYDFSYNSTFNPVAVNEATTREAAIYGLLGSVGAKYKIMDWLSFETKLSLDLNYVQNSYFYPPEFGDGRTVNGRGSFGTSLWNNWVSTNILRFNRKFGVDHGVSAFLGYEAQRTRNNTSTTVASNFLPGKTTLANASKPEGTETTQTENALTGAFVNASYNFREKYYLSGSVRRDGSSRFGADRRFGTFWSLGLAWNVHMEPFMQSQQTFSELKLRTSYGTNGNQDIGNFASRGLYNSGSDYDGRPGYALSQFPNRYLTWEQNKPFNVGLDFGLWKNRITGTIEYYERVTSSLLLDVPVSSVNGVTTVARNAGSMKNSGWEITLSSRNIISDNDGGFNWNTDFNISTQKNRITQLDNDMTGTFLRTVGNDFYQYFMQGFAGVDPQTGEALWYKDGSKSGTTKNYGEAQRFTQGSALPKFFGGLTNSFGYKGFSLSFQVFFNWGNKVFDSWASFTESDGSSGFNATGKMSRYLYNNRWQKPGDITDVPRVFYLGRQTGLSNQNSSRFIYDGSYIRLRDVTFAYQLPKSWLQSAKIKDVKLYVRANNLFTYVKDKHLTMDPEVPVTGVFDQRPPVFKTLLAGIDINF